MTRPPPASSRLLTPAYVALWLSDGETFCVCDTLETAPAPWAEASVRISEPAPRLVVLGGDPTALGYRHAGGVQAGWETTLVRPRDRRRAADRRRELPP